MTNWRLVKKAVNSKALFLEISEFVEEGLTDMGVVWSSDTHRESFVEIVEDWLEEKAFEGKIEQLNVICDYRNNKGTEMEQGKYVLDVFYKQRNCLNMTHLHYEIEYDNDTIAIDFGGIIF